MPFDWLPQFTTTHRYRGNSGRLKEFPMEDLIWLGFLVGLLAVTLAYVRLCDKA